MSRSTPALLVLLGLIGLLPGLSPAAEITPVRHVLPNGMVVLIVDQPSLPLVTVNVLLKAGAVYDPDPLAGLSSMVARMLDEGTRTRSATQIAQAIEFIGGELATRDGDDVATASLRILKKDAALGFTLLADILMNPVFSQKELERVRSQILGQIQGEHDDPGTVARKAFAELVFQGHPYRRPVQGTERTVPRITRKDLVQFHQTYYRPNQAIMAIVGDLRESEALAAVHRHFGAWKKKEVPAPTFPAPALLERPMLKLIDKDLTQANVVWGHVGIARKNPDFYAVAVMNYILGGGGFSSRLVTRIRDEQGLAYDVDSGFEADLMPGPFTVQLQTRNRTANQAIAGILDEIIRIRTEPVSEQELADAKAYLTGSFPLRLDTTSKLAALLTMIELHELGLSYFDDYPKAINAVTTEDVLRAAQRYLHPHAYALVVVAKQAEAQINQEVIRGKP